MASLLSPSLPPLIRRCSALIALALALTRGILCGQTPTPTAPPAIAAPTEPTAVLQKLKGKWLRPDGGYVIDIRSVAADGKLEAFYYNPRSINVAKAEASQTGDAVKVFIEFRDTNYPGSTYTLTYNASNDRLEGIYFQAVQKENFDVEFRRLPDKAVQ